MNPVILLLVICVLTGPFWVYMVWMWLQIIKALFIRLYNAIELGSKKPKNNHGVENGGWTILGFDKLLAANIKAKSIGGNMKTTVHQKSTGKTYVVELYEVREESDSTIRRIEE